jgi:predicted small lipoprotein YifL
MCAGFVVAGLLAFAACGGKGASYVSSSQSNAAQSNSPAAGELRYKAPDGWVKEQTTSTMRVAQYKLPKTEGDAEVPCCLQASLFRAAYTTLNNNYPFMYGVAGGLLLRCDSGWGSAGEYRSLDFSNATA